MQAIVIDPYEKSIELQELNKGQLDEMFGGTAYPHWIVPHFLPKNIGYVDAHGLVDGKKVWYFSGVHVWGAMVIVGAKDTDAKTTVKEVESYVIFN